MCYAILHWVIQNGRSRGDTPSESGGDTRVSMDNQYLRRSMTAEDRAIIVLSINYMLELGDGALTDANVLQAIGEELFKQQPRIASNDLPLI